MKLNKIKEMERIARANKSIVSLGQGIPTIPTDDSLHQAAIEAIRAGNVDVYSDPQGIIELREELSAHLCKQNMDYSLDEIIVTNGAIEAIVASLRAFITPEKNEVIIPTPAYSAHLKAVEAAGGKIVECQLDESHRWILDAPQIITGMNERTAAVLLCNPNNPTGMIYDEASINKILVAAQDRNIIVVIDEVYRNIVYTHKAIYSPATLPKYKQTLVRVMSFSKDFSLTGWRVGYLQTSYTNVQKILGIHDTLVNCVPVVSQFVARQALIEYDRIILSNQNIYALRRQQMMTHLDGLRSVLKYHEPQGGYYIFPRLLRDTNSEALSVELARAGVVVIPGSAFGSGGENHFRLCFGRSEVSIDEGMKIIKSVLIGGAVQ